jgi:hypothetical protein
MLLDDFVLDLSVGKSRTVDCYLEGPVVDILYVVGLLDSWNSPLTKLSL